MKNTVTRGWLLRMRPLTRFLVAGAIVTSLSVARTAQNQAPNVEPGDIDEGMRLYQQKGNCQACHGWAADGRKSDNQMPDAPSLREKTYPRTMLTQTIKCGRPGTSMPAFDKFAYSDGRCYNMK